MGIQAVDVVEVPEFQTSGYRRLKIIVVDVRVRVHR
jgi:hypothetical protein